MSDPIQAIATNNYLLATQQEVSHDNTLSGNGTVDSPLGLNETVLWSGSEQSGCTLSESCRNFEKILIKFKSNDEYYYEHVMDASSTAFVLLAYQSGTNVWLKLAKYTLSDTQISVSSPHEVTLANGSSVSVSSTNCLTLLKVIGINRKVQ